MVLDTLKSGARIFRNQGTRPFLWKPTDYLGAWKPIWNTTTTRYPIGTNVFEREWDLLIILDACRVHTLREVSQDVPWLDSVGAMRSVGSMTPEWTLKTFTEDYREAIEDTALIAGNGFVHKILDGRIHEEPTYDGTQQYHDIFNKGFPNGRRFRRTPSHTSRRSGRQTSRENPTLIGNT